MLLHCISSVDPRGGGPIEGIHQLARENRKFGHVTEIVSLDLPIDPWVLKDEMTVHALGCRWGNGYGYSPKLVPWLKAHHSQYDAIIINGIWGYNAFGAWRALRRTATPYFVFTHGMLDPWFNRHYPLKYLKKRLYYRWGLYPVLRDAKAVLFTCEEERRQARLSFRPYHCNERVVAYGTEGIPAGMEGAQEHFLAKHPTLQGKRLFLFLGRVHPKKGLDLLLHAIADLKVSGLWDSSTMRLVVAGPNEDSYAQTLKRLAHKLGIEPSVHWTGMVQGMEKWGAFQASEAYILPSHQENFGISVAEALSASKPVLLGKGVNIWPDICKAGAGFAENPDVKGVKQLLSSWLALAPAQQAQMASAARACFLSQYSSENAAKSVIETISVVTGNTAQIAALTH